MDNGKMEKNTEKVFTLMQTKMFFLVGGHLVKNMGKAHMFMLQLTKEYVLKIKYYQILFLID